MPTVFSKITLKQARAFVLRRQMLDSRTKVAGALQAVRRLGYIQIDTINVVERAHHHTLWSRVPGYRPGVLDGLQRQGKVFEYLAHAMCYLPMEDCRFYRRHMEEFPAKSKWYKGYHKKYGRLADEVLARIRAEGPLSTAEFEGPKRRKRQGWWDWKPAKTALEMLFYRGDLMVAGRRGFQRVYDLAERVLPKGFDTSVPAEEETKRFFVRRALAAMGLATEQDIDKYITVAGRLGAQLAAMEKGGEVRRLHVEGLPKPYFISGELNERIGRGAELDDKAKLLSPFDNAVILRERTKSLFGFDFTMECYVPAAKREYGYFSLPILWRNGLVGRLDPKADRESGTLLVRSLHLERSIPSIIFYRSLACALEEYAVFNKCGKVRLSNGRSGPARMLSKYL